MNEILAEFMYGINVPNSGGPLTLGRTEDLLRIIGNYLLTFGIIIAVGTIVWGGIQYMVSPEKADAAKGRIKNGVIGSAVVLGVGLILKTIASVITGCFFGTFLGIFCR